jgi:hypothetical protein
MGQRPVVILLVTDDRMSLALQRAHHSPQEVRIAMIPIRDNGVIEEREPHQASTS